MEQRERTEYAEAVWDKFLEKTDSGRLTMTPAEFGLVQLWMSQIPLRIVLRGMDDTQGKGRTLSYYGPSVLEAYRRWRSLLS